METFEIPAEDVMLGEVHKRLNEQQEIVDTIIGAMGAKYNELKEPVDKTVGTIKRQAKRYAKQRTGQQQALVDDIIQTMGNEAGQRLANQQAIVDQITAYMMTAPQIIGVPGCTPTGFAVYRQSSGQCVVFAEGCGDALPPGKRGQSFPTRAQADAWVAANCGVKPPPPPPPPPGKGEVWYAFCHEPRDPQGQLARDVIQWFPGHPLPGVSRLGPFSTEIEAFAALPKLDCGTSGGGGGDGGGGGNGQICPPQVQPWYIACPAEGGPATCVRWDSVKDGTLVKGGPYDTEDECKAALPSACADPCSTITTDWKPKLPSTTCGICGLDKLPVPGSPEWCEQEASIRAQCVETGRWMVDQIKDMLYVKEGTPFFSELPTLSITSGVGVVAQFSKILLSWVVDNWTALRDKIRQLIECWEQFTTSFGCGEPKQVVALAILRGLLRMLSHFAFGFELPLVARTELGVELMPLERILTYLLEAACPSVIPTPGESIETWVQGGINEDTFKCWLSAYGVSREVWDPVLKRRGDHLQAREVIQWGRRNGLDSQRIDSELRDIGWVRDDDRERVQYLYDSIGTVGDYLHFLQRNVFDTDYVNKYDLLEGFEERFWKNYGDNLIALGITKELAKQHFAAHWINATPTQMHEFLYRLRPDKEGVQNPFLLQDFKTLMMEQDYAPRVIKWFAETAYRVPAFSYTTRQYQLSIIDDAQLKSRIMDQGYDDDTSAEMVDAMRYDKYRVRADQSMALTPRTAGKLVLAGLLTTEEADQELALQGFSEDEIKETYRVAELEYKRSVGLRAITTARMRLWRQIDQSYRAGTVSRDEAMGALVKAGWPDSAASVLLSTADAAVQQSLAREVVTSMKKAYLGGLISDADAMAHLTAAGISTERAGQHIATWGLELIAHAKHATTGDILRWVREGYLGPVAAHARLANLGWRNPDLLLLLAENYARYEASVIKRQQAAQKDAKKAAAELERLQRAHQAEIKRIQAQMMKYEPISEIKRLFINGRRTLDWVKRRLAAGGYPPDSVADYAQTWQDERSAAWEKWQKKHEGYPPPGRPGGGGPSGP